ncbi:MAG: DUF2703 domain-containing protein [Candidatus Zixiibacteriota bacterium]
MKIEFLYFDGCPNHLQALNDLKKTLTEMAIDSDIKIIEINNNQDAVEKRFLGSPSIRINGKDIEIEENESTEYSMRCRRYRSGSEILGYPPKNLITAILKKNMGVTQ